MKIIPNKLLYTPQKLMPVISNHTEVPKLEKKGSSLPSILLATAGMFLFLNTASPKSKPLNTTLDPIELTDKKQDSIPTATNNTPPKITTNFHQGSDVGNCVGVAILKSFARNDIGREYLDALVEKNPTTNAYTVSFPNKPKITINNSLITKYNAVVGNDYAEAITFALYKDAKNLDDQGNWKQGDITRPRSIALSDRGTFTRLTGLEPNCSHGSTKDLKAIHTSLNSGNKLLMTTSFRKGVEKCSDYKAFPNHEFELISVDTTKNVVKIANPWYSEEEKTFEMNIDDFQEFNDGINILGIKKDNSGKTVFYNPENIGTKPGEVNYEDYFNFISYEPTTEDINEYFSRPENKDIDNNSFTLGFWAHFDSEGYDKHVNKTYGQISITPDSIKTDMPTYTMLRSEKYHPIGLVKQYMLNKTIPTFKHQELNDKKESLQKWLNEEAGNVKFSIQSKHYNDSIKAAKLKKEEAIAARKRAEEEARIKAEEFKKQEEQARLQKPITELTNEITNFKPEGYTGGVVPNDVKLYKDIYGNASYNAQTRKIYHTDKIFKENLIISFDKSNHVTSIIKKKDGQVIAETKYSYPEPGVRVAHVSKGQHDEEQTEREVYNENGLLIASTYYNHERKLGSIREYIIAPDGKELVKSFIKKAVKGYNVHTSIYYSCEYDFNQDGSMKEKREYSMEREQGSKEFKKKNETKTIYLQNGKEKIYWNNEYKAYREYGDTYDGNGNKLKSYIISELPTIAEE